jgi:hypothetical protein
MTCVRMHTQQSTVTIAAEDIGHMGPASDAVMIRRRIAHTTINSDDCGGQCTDVFHVSSMCLGVCHALRGRFSKPATCHLDSSSFLLISCSAWTFFIVSSMCLGACRALRGRVSVPATCHLDSSSFLLISCSAQMFFIMSSMCLGICRALCGPFGVPLCMTSGGNPIAAEWQHVSTLPQLLGILSPF